MKAKAQFRWAIVFRNGHINHSTMAFTRKSVIRHGADQARQFATISIYGDLSKLTDAQVWRKLKRHRGYAVRRISLRVVA